MTYEKSKQVLCNWCGLSCNLTDKQHMDDPYGLINIKAVGGYPSTPGNGYGALDDNDCYPFSLCEFCLDHLFSQFNIPVMVHDVANHMRPVCLKSERENCLPLVMPPEPFMSATERVNRDDWRELKDEFFAEKKKRDEARRGRLQSE